MAHREWRPGDGAEQNDSSMEAAQERLSTGYWTAESHSEEAVDGFDTAFLSWRETHGEALDDDYRRWRRETGQVFSSAFLDWAKAK